jgi:hypothetical protein
MNNDLITWAIRHHVSFEAIAELRKMWGDAAGPSYIDDTLRGHVSEATIQSQCILDAPRRGMHLFRNNVGALLDKDGRMVRFGLANDSKRRNEVLKSGDLIGIDPVLITSAHVGRTIGQFVSAECKRPGWTYSGQGREPAQLAWIQLVIASGGRAKFVTDAGEL